MKKYIILLVLGLAVLPGATHAMNLAQYGCHGSGCPTQPTYHAENGTLKNCQKYGWVCNGIYDNMTPEQFAAYTAPQPVVTPKPVVKAIAKPTVTYYAPFPGLRMCIQ